MATYGIETYHGLYCMSKREKNLEIPCPEILRQGIEIYFPDSENHTFYKLNHLKLLYQSFVLNERNCFKSFYVNGDVFARGLCLFPSDETNNLLQTHDISGLNKLKFRWNGQYHILENESSDGDNSNQEYGISKFNGHHPISDSVEYNPVYNNYQQVISALKTIQKYNEVLNLSPHIKSVNECNLFCEHHLNHPFIVVEGLDGTGKSTLAINLANYLNGIAMATPPPSISGIRKKFDHLPEIYRRAYYALSNYIAAEEVLEYTKTKPVVMDRFWHSTTAYAIASEVGCGTVEYLPPKGHSIYMWPTDLIYPSAVIFLKTKETDRDSRVNERIELTEEETEISANRDFRARIIETYRNIDHEKWIEIDSSGTKEETLEKTVKALQYQGIC